MIIKYIDGKYLIYLPSIYFKELIYKIFNFLIIYFIFKYWFVVIGKYILNIIILYY